MSEHIETFNSFIGKRDRVAVIGSRNFNDYKIFADKIHYFTKNIQNICFVSGGCKTGADNLIERYCNANDLPILIFYPNYTEFGKSAPLKRNHQIVDNCDMLIAFWDGISKGTKYTLDLVDEKLIPNRIVKI